MKLIIAEKSSVGRDIARIVGATTNKTDWMEGNGYLVSWAAGHLVEKSAPTDDIPWDAEHLPLLPDRFTLSPRKTGSGKDRKNDPRCVHQLKVLSDLARRCDLVINAGDAGREGEVIQRYIYKYIGLDKPVKRLWVSSMTDAALRDSLRDLRPSSDYDNLFAAGDQRTMADWLVGINATRALTAAAAKKGIRRFFSLGRVQTPTLALVCKRFIENRDFKSVPFWNVVLELSKDGDTFIATSGQRFEDEETAQRTRSAAVSCGAATVTSFEQKERDEMPPLLHDITTLEKEAINKFGFTGAKADELLESLYMKKVMTYPRTGSNYIPDDVYKTIPTLLRVLNASDDKLIREGASSLLTGPLSRHSVNADKVTDHHALLVTENDPKRANLTTDEWKIYNLVALRMLQAFSAPCHVKVSKAVFDCAGVVYTATGRTVLRPGWRALAAPDDSAPEDEPAQALPVLTEEESLPVENALCKEGKTKPKPLYTEATLRDAMKTAGKDSDDKEVKDALKDIGIGTPATRTSIIETLKNRQYITESKKKIIPTETGLAVYDAVKDMKIASPELTGRWEAALGFIADGKMNASDFNTKVRRYAEVVVEEILSTDVAGISEATAPKTIVCPRCGKDAIRLWPTNAKCQDCGLTLWREVMGKKLSDDTLSDILLYDKSKKLSGFVSKKTGNKFDARLKLILPDPADTDEKTRDRCTLQFVFDDQPKKTLNKKGKKRPKKL